MPDAAGNIKGIALSGKAGEVLEKIKTQEKLECLSCGGNNGYGPAPHHDPDCYFASHEDTLIAPRRNTR